MARTKPEAFPIFPSDFFGSPRVAALSGIEQCVYLGLLVRLWQLLSPRAWPGPPPGLARAMDDAWPGATMSGGLPADVGQLADLMRISRDSFKPIWERLRHFFVQTEEGLFVNPRVLEEYSHVIARADRLSDAGRRGREKQLGKRLPPAPPCGPGPGHPRAWPGHPVPSRPVPSSPPAPPEEEAREEPARPDPDPEPEPPTPRPPLTLLGEFLEFFESLCPPQYQLNEAVEAFKGRKLLREDLEAWKGCLGQAAGQDLRSPQAFVRSRMLRYPSPRDAMIPWYHDPVDERKEKENRGRAVRIYSKPLEGAVPIGRLLKEAKDA